MKQATRTCQNTHIHSGSSLLEFQGFLMSLGKIPWISIDNQFEFIHSCLCSQLERIYWVSMGSVCPKLHREEEKGNN